MMIDMSIQGKIGADTARIASVNYLMVRLRRRGRKRQWVNGTVFLIMS